MVIDSIAQVWIAVFGVLAIFCANRDDKWQKYGCIMGVIAQPAWYITTYVNEQWGIMFLSLFYSYSWGMGVYNFWIKPRRLTNGTNGIRTNYSSPNSNWNEN